MKERKGEYLVVGHWPMKKIIKEAVVTPKSPCNEECPFKNKGCSLLEFVHLHMNTQREREVRYGGDEGT